MPVSIGIEANTRKVCAKDKFNTYFISVLAFKVEEELSALFITSQDRESFYIDDNEAPVLTYAYSLNKEENGTFSLRGVKSGKFLCASRPGDVSEDRDKANTWEQFTLEPADDVEQDYFAHIKEIAEEVKKCNAGIDHRIVKTILCMEHISLEIRKIFIHFLSSDEAKTLASAISAADFYPEFFSEIANRLRTIRKFAVITRDRLRDGIRQHGWDIGEHSYGVPTVIDGEHGPLKIGRYCSMAPGIFIVVSNHAIDTITTYPFGTLSDCWPSAPHVDDHENKGGVEIGHSVWIGARACILPGARIGDGAIIGAESVVTGVIPPFAVAVGNPAIVKRIRFNDVTIKRLLAVSWWNWPDYKVDRSLPLIMNGDMEAFLTAAERS